MRLARSSASARASSSIFLISTAAACLRLVDDLRHQLAARLVGAHAGELLELGLGLVEQLLGAARGRLGSLLAAGDGLLLLVELGLAPLERARFLGQLLFAAAQRLFRFLQLGCDAP